MARIGTDMRIALAQAIELADVERLSPATVRGMEQLLAQADDVEMTDKRARLLARAVRFVRNTGAALDRGMTQVRERPTPMRAPRAGEPCTCDDCQRSYGPRGGPHV